MDKSQKAAREMTAEEWVARLLSGEPHELTPGMLAAALKAAESRGATRERRACGDLAHQHAMTINEDTVAMTPLGSLLDKQGRIDVAASQRHVAQYVGVLISQRTPPPPRPLRDPT